MTAVCNADGNDAREHLGRRFEELSDVLQHAKAERDLALYLAYRRGLTTREIADVVREDVVTVQAIIGTYLRDEDADSYEEGPRWVEMWPNHGWGATL